MASSLAWLHRLGKDIRTLNVNKRLIEKDCRATLQNLEWSIVIPIHHPSVHFREHFLLNEGERQLTKPTSCFCIFFYYLANPFIFWQLVFSKMLLHTVLFMPIINSFGYRQSLLFLPHLACSVCMYEWTYVYGGFKYGGQSGCWVSHHSSLYVWDKVSDITGNSQMMLSWLASSPWILLSLPSRTKIK